MMVEQARKTLGIPLEVPFKNLFEAEQSSMGGLRPAVRQKRTGGPSATFEKGPTGDIREMKEAAN
jgi:hypothetical protein